MEAKQVLQVAGEDGGDGAVGTSDGDSFPRRAASWRTGTGVPDSAAAGREEMVVEMLAYFSGVMV
jgi:hypothetical protein